MTTARLTAWATVSAGRWTPISLQQSITTSGANGPTECMQQHSSSLEDTALFPAPYAACCILQASQAFPGRSSCADTLSVAISDNISGPDPIAPFCVRGCSCPGGTTPKIFQLP